MVNEIVETPKNTSLAAISGGVESGGISGSDMEIPRCSLLQSTSPVLKDNKNLNEGEFINSVTQEVLSGRFIPLFPFKQYAKFSMDGKLEWTTVNRNDPRVINGLKWIDNQKPEVTEFLNFMIVMEANPDIPLILSFKSTSLKVGKQFLTLLELKRTKTKKPYYAYTYELGSKVQARGAQSWFVPKIGMPTEKHEVENHSVYADMVSQYQPLVQNVNVEASDPVDFA